MLILVVLRVAVQTKTIADADQNPATDRTVGVALWGLELDLFEVVEAEPQR